jgi:L-rhamnose mutarotase
MKRRTNRYVLTLDLRDDPAMIAAYRKYHAEMWPEVVRSLRDAGVQHLEIHLLGRRLVMIVELREGLDIQRVFERHASSTPKVVEWERLMKTFQQPAPDARPGEWWALMDPVCEITDVPQHVRAAGTPDPIHT